MLSSFKDIPFRENWKVISEIKKGWSNIILKPKIMKSFFFVLLILNFTKAKEKSLNL